MSNVILDSLRTGLAQIAPRLGDVQANLETHLRLIDAASQQHVQLLIFPELSLTGYMMRDLVATVALPPRKDNEYVGKIVDAAAQHDMDVVFSFVAEDARHRFHAAAVYASQGEIQHLHQKIFLPTYGMFDEARYLAPGETVSTFDTRWGCMGLLICEDFWHMSAPYLLWMDGADILIFVSASPGRGIRASEQADARGRLGSSRFVELMTQSYAASFTNFVLHCNRVGYEDGINFWGGSAVISPEGEILCQAPYFEETLLVADLDLSLLRRTRSALPLLRDERPFWFARELKRILQQTDGR